MAGEGAWPKGHSLQPPALDQSYYEEIRIEVQSKCLETLGGLSAGTSKHNRKLSWCSPGGTMGHCLGGELTLHPGRAWKDQVQSVMGRKA